jgi:hypothetical protein
VKTGKGELTNEIGKYIGEWVNDELFGSGEC